MLNKENIRRTRVIRSWARIYDLVNSVVFLLFKGTRKLHQDIISMAQLKSGDTVLDIGCGTGNILVEIAKEYDNVKGYGIDASGEMISIARERAENGKHDNLKFEIAQAETLPYGDGTFDGVFNIFLLHHLPMESKLESLKEAHRVLRPGKPFVLVDVDKPVNLLGRCIGLTRYNVREIRENMQQPLMDLLKTAGFLSPRLVRQDYGIFSFIKCVR